MTKLAVSLFIIFIAALGYLAILNKETVTLKLGENHIYEIPKIALILLSGAFGALSMLIIVAIRDTKHYIENWRNQRQQKRDLRIQEAYGRGLDAFIAGKDEEAEEIFNRIIQDELAHLNSLLRLGDIAFKTGNKGRAKDFYTKAREIQPRNIEVLFSLEKVFEAEQKWNEALRYLDNILEMDEENPNALYRKREVYETNKNWEALLDVQYKILKSDIPQREKQKEHKNLAGYKYELGCHYLEKGDIEKAKKVLKAIIKLDKNFSSAYLALAESYLREGNVEESESLLIKGYETIPTLALLMRLEDILIGVGEPGRIIDIYQKAIQNNPADPKLHFLLAKLYYRLEMIDYAFEKINAALDTATVDYHYLHTLLGNIYEKRMQHDKASQEFKKALKVDKPVLVPFCCHECGYTTKDWLGRCPECKSWNTFAIDLDGTCKA
ncbi:MAG: tetratricopeptide repeat protein [Nitrospirae bacterium]|nr:tetratricopeptide repeat protein [Nitrospirota bacterium]